MNKIFGYQAQKRLLKQMKKKENLMRMAKKKKLRQMMNYEFIFLSF